MKKPYPFLLLVLWILLAIGCDSNNAQTKTAPLIKNKKIIEINSPQKDTTKTKAPKVTFIELGSINCIPCRMMQPVMKAVEEDYGDQVRIVFYDVWKDPAPARQYRIRVIPTQIFLDESGKEFFRHEGFYPKEEIDRLLGDKGVKKIKSAS